jgi:hypothetical protein
MLASDRPFWREYLFTWRPCETNGLEMLTYGLAVCLIYVGLLGDVLSYGSMSVWTMLGFIVLGFNAAYRRI